VIRDSSAAVVPAGISVGHYTDDVGLTGCTVILMTDGATASVETRGGAPGTLDTDLLSPFASVGEIHGILLTGGSAPGLGAAAGVSSFLREKGHGYPTPYARVPLVAGAVIYDLGVGSPRACPTPDDAYQAAISAGSRFDEGSVGVGTGATVGKLLGGGGHVKGGIGFSSLLLAGGATVGALSVVNALGDVLGEDGSIIAGARRQNTFVGGAGLLLNMPEGPTFTDLQSTTLSVVMTDARLDKTQCALVARMAHDGMARAINPVHTPMDGDCIFAVSTGRLSAHLFQVSTAAALTVAASIRRAVRVATGFKGIPSLRDLEESAAGGPTIQGRGSTGPDHD
jgi:L-aminopeptidase/D-esterase-like protein